MAVTQGTRGTGVAAALIAAALHVVVMQWLLAQRVTTRTVSAPALQVTWIEPVAAPTTDGAPETSRSPPPVHVQARNRSGIAPTTSRDTPDAAPAEAGDTPVPGRGHDLMREAQAWSRQQPLQAEFLPDPLRHRDVATDGPFAMRDPVTVADVANAIGQLMGGPGYTTDPCPRVDENINRLSQSGDSELLQEELRRKRALCD